MQGWQLVAESMRKRQEEEAWKEYLESSEITFHPEPTLEEVVKQPRGTDHPKRAPHSNKKRKRTRAHRDD